MLRCASDADALALVALLNSPVVAAWLSLLAEPARGGYRRYMAWTVALLPIPRRWAESRDDLARIACAAWGGCPPHDDELTDAACRAYGVTPREVRPLLEWDER
ncbi:MAG TPA: hypothetical protein VGE02_08865 [Gemmatimonadales bacterium]